MNKINKFTLSRAVHFLKQYPFEVIASVVLFLIYVVLFDRYLPNDIDDTWTTAWIYYFMEEGTTRDLVFMPDAPDYWGIRFFSHIFSYIYGTALSIIGFTRSNVHILSNLFAVGSMVLLYFTGKRLLPDRRSAVDYALMMAASTLFFASANKARTDIFVLFFLLLSLYLFMEKRYFFSGMAACIAIETHPIGGLVFCYLGAYALVYDRELLLLKNKKGFFAFASAGLSGALIYVLLHVEELDELRSMFDSLGESGNFLYAHFMGRANFAWRYWPDLVLFCGAGIVLLRQLIRRGEKPETAKSFTLLSSALLILGSFVFTRGNFHYALFCYPAFVLMVMQAFGNMRWKNVPLIPVLFICVQLPQYAYLHHRNAWGRDDQAYQHILQNYPFSRELLIYGHPADWFAVKERRAFRSLTHFSMPKQDFYLIEHSGTHFLHPDAVKVPKDRLTIHSSQIFPLTSGGNIHILHVSPKGDTP